MARRGSKVVKHEACVAGNINDYRNVKGKWGLGELVYTYTCESCWEFEAIYHKPVEVTGTC